MLKLFNSMTRKLEEFQPANDKTVKMYTCGPSIYQLPHIGNYRTFLFEDILLRYLEYLRFKVERALFITDVEDKAIIEAKKEHKTLKELTEINTKTFLEELEKLRGKRPTCIPRVSTSINESVQLIEALLEKGYAYRHNSNVYYSPLRFRRFGRLYRLDMAKWPKQKRRFHKDTYPGNRWNLGDFILWHGYKPEDNEACWKTTLGTGRPAWNVQDPAMVMKTLGPEADLFCGGVDNLIRHHDYNIAVIEAATGKQLAKFWLHGEHLFVDGKKMSKSRGNIVYPGDLIGRGCEWQHIRFFLINGYYRKRLNFTFAKFEKACRRLHQFRDMINQLQTVRTSKQGSYAETERLVANLKHDFEACMNNDLQVRSAFDATFRTTSRLVTLAKRGKLSNKDAEDTVAHLKSIDQVMQVIF